MKQILFNTEMVKAILDGRKTETRRPVKGLDKETYKVEFENGVIYGTWGGCVSNTFYDGHNEIIPKIKNGDVVFVGEEYHEDNTCILYKASIYENVERHHGSDGQWHDIKWKPNKEMTEMGARIFLKIISVRIERLQDMPHDAAMKEGIGCDGISNPTNKFIQLWDSIYKDAYPSASNPWVVVYEFERCDKP